MPTIYQNRFIQKLYTHTPPLPQLRTFISKRVSHYLTITAYCRYTTEKCPQITKIFSYNTHATTTHTKPLSKQKMPKQPTTTKKYPLDLVTLSRTYTHKHIHLPHFFPIFSFLTLFPLFSHSQ